MVMKHQRLNALARYLHRCPNCGAWFSLKVTNKESGAMGKQTDFTCEQCHAEFHDWKPSSSVKF